MEKLFYPDSIVVFGVSPREGNLGKIIVGNLLRFEYPGKIYMYSPRGGVIFGQQIISNLDDIPPGVDLGVIITPALTVPQILEVCGKKGIRRVVIESAGFGEFSEERKALEQELVDIAKKYGMRFVGPNGLGIINFEKGVVLPFSHFFPERVKVGPISILSQSGGIGISYIDLLSFENLGVNKFVSLGNKTNMDETDFLEYLNADPSTKIIAMYLEGIKDGRKFIEVGKHVTKPVIIHKSNIGKSSQNIAKSHTASLAVDDNIVDAAIKQLGFVRVHTLNNMVNAAKVFSLPPMKGNKIAIISRSGGHAVVAADAVDRYGFELAQFSENFLKEIQKHFRANVISPTNPLDLGDMFDFGLYAAIIEQTLKETNIDGLVFLHIYSATQAGISRPLIPKIKELSEKYNKPIAVVIFSTQDEVATVKKMYGFPIFDEPGDALRALSISRDYNLYRHEFLDTRNPEEINEEKIASILEGKRNLDLVESLQVIEAAGIRVAPYHFILKDEDPHSYKGKINFPLAMKIVSTEGIHKTEVGGVILNIKDEEMLIRRFNEIIQNAEEHNIPYKGVLLQEMIGSKRELIIGAHLNQSFGHVVLFGLGGIMVEVFKDVSFGIVPFGEKWAEYMIQSIRGYNMLEAFRDEPRADIEAIQKSIMRVAKLVEKFPKIKELDINPIFALTEGKGVVAVDARIILE